MNYSYFYKSNYKNVAELKLLPKYDLFISSYVNSHRVIEPSEHIPADRKVWFFSAEDGPDLFLFGKEKIKISANEDYATFMQALKDFKLIGKRICVDATGFKIPYLMYLMRCMVAFKIKKFDIIYTEPTLYREAENTRFSDIFNEVKLIEGMKGLNTSRNDNDLLIIAAGYDHSRIADVANDRKSCKKKVLLFGFPAVSPGMFQENILRAYKAEEAIATECFKDMDSNIYAPAYDPFVTAQAINEYIQRQQNSSHKNFTSIYLAPLSTKPHAIGMALYFLWELGWEKSINLIYPFCQQYIVDNSDGIARVWRYEIELPT